MTGEKAARPYAMSDVLEMISGFGHQAALGIRYTGYGDDWAEATMPYSQQLVGVSETGVVASGPVVALIDMTCGAAVLARLGRFSLHVTLDLRVDYLRPATPGRDLHARVECYRLTRQVAFVRGAAHDGDPADPVANVSGTFMLLPKEGAR